MEPEPVIVPPGQGHRVGNVEFLARTVDTPASRSASSRSPPGRELEAHVHPGEDDAFYIVEGEMTFTFGEEAAAPPGTFVLAAAGGRARLPQRRRSPGAHAEHPRAGRLRPSHRPSRLIQATGCTTGACGRNGVVPVCALLHDDRGGLRHLDPQARQIGEGLGDDDAVLLGDRWKRGFSGMQRPHRRASAETNSVRDLCSAGVADGPQPLAVAESERHLHRVLDAVGAALASTSPTARSTAPIGSSSSPNVSAR